VPAYDYYCEKCDITIEVIHSIQETPEIYCEKCKEKMKRIVSGGTGYIIKNGSTRRQTWTQRHGHKKDSSRTTATEAAKQKGIEKMNEIQNTAAKAADPYHEFRN